MPVDPILLTDRVAAALGTLTRFLPRYVAGVSPSPTRPGEFEVLNPFDPDRCLRVSTAGGKATLAFGGCHAHFADADASETDLAGEVLVKLVLLVSGAEASYTAWDGDHCLGGAWLRAGADRVAGRGEKAGQVAAFERLQPWTEAGPLADAPALTRFGSFPGSQPGQEPPDASPFGSRSAIH